MNEDRLTWGVQALHPFDPYCTDTVTAKQGFDWRLCLLRKVSSDQLMNGRREQVQEAYLALLRSLATRRVLPVRRQFCACLKRNRQLPRGAEHEPALRSLPGSHSQALWVRCRPPPFRGLDRIRRRLNAQ
jgi:hypothetical protein